MICLPVVVAFFFQPAPTYTISGTVVQAANGRPLSKVKLTLSPTNPSVRVKPVVTGDDGRFQFTGLPAGKYGLYADRLGFARQGYGQHVLYQQYSTGIVIDAQHQAENLVFPLIAGGVIAGYVRDAQGESIAGMTVQAVRVLGYGANRHPGLRAQQVTDDRGYYRIPSLPRGNFALVVAGNPQPEIASVKPEVYPVTFFPNTDDPSAAQSIPVSPGMETRADVIVRSVPAAQVTGDVPPPPAGVREFVGLSVPSVFGTEMPIVSSQWVTGNQFKFERVPAGHFVLNVVQETRWVGRHLVEVSAPQTTLHLTETAPARVRVRVEFSGGAAPQTETDVVQLQALNGSSAQAQPLRDQLAEFSAVPPGRYVPLVVRGRQMAITAIEAQGAGQSGDVIDIPESGDVEIGLTVDRAAVDLDGVVLQNGTPRAAAVAMLVKEEGWETFGGYRFDQSDGDGTFTFHAVPRGEYRLFAFQGGEPADYDDPDVIRKWFSKAQRVAVTGDPKQTVRIEMFSSTAPTR